jgi:cytochrome P450
MLTGGGVEVGVQDVVDEVKTFVLAGHETTASMLAWCTAEVGRDERVREKLREEAEKVWNQEEKDFTKVRGLGERRERGAKDGVLTLPLSA